MDLMTSCLRILMVTAVIFGAAVSHAEIQEDAFAAVNSVLLGDKYVGVQPDHAICAVDVYRASNGDIVLTTNGEEEAVVISKSDFSDPIAKFSDDGKTIAVTIDNLSSYFPSPGSRQKVKIERAVSGGISAIQIDVYNKALLGYITTSLRSSFRCQF